MRPVACGVRLVRAAWVARGESVLEARLPGVRCAKAKGSNNGAAHWLRA